METHRHIHILQLIYNLPNTDEITLVTNLGEASLAKETARFIDAFLPKLLIKLPNTLPRNLLDSMILGNCLFLRLSSVDMMRVKAFLIFVFYLVARRLQPYFSLKILVF